MPALLELQRGFAAALHGAPQDAEAFVAGDEIAAADRLHVYRNNSRATFEQALVATFAVVHGRVGDDYFRQLAHFYRQACPSRSGDLHEVGRRFAEFLQAHLAGTPYAWLAELAALEWAVAEAGVAADAVAATVSALAAVPPEALAGARLRLMPSLQLLSARTPVLSVWRSGQESAAQTKVDLDAGPEYVLVYRDDNGVRLSGVDPEEFAFVAALARGETIEAALDATRLPLDRFALVLRRLFDEALVAQVVTAPTHDVIPDA